MDPPLSTSSHRKRAVSGPSHTASTITRSSQRPPPSPSSATRSKKPKLQSPLELGHASGSSSSRPPPPAGMKRARKPVATRRGGEVATGSSALTPDGPRKGKAKMMMEEEEQMELTRPDLDERGDDGAGGDVYVYDLVGIKRDELESEVFSFLHAAYGHIRASLIARVSDPWINYAAGETSTPQVDILTPLLAPILVQLKPLLLRRCLDVLRDGDEDLYDYDAPICTEEMLDREEFIYAPLRLLLQTLQLSEHRTKLATPGPKSATAGHVKNAVGWTLLRIGRAHLEDPRWERDCLAEDGTAEGMELDGARFRLIKRRGESYWEEAVTDDDEEREGEGGDEPEEGGRMRSSE